MLLIQLVLLAGSVFTGFLLYTLIRASRSMRKKQQLQQEPEKAPREQELTRDQVEANIANDQWELLSGRLGQALVAKAEESSWTASLKEQRKCVGVISLDVDNAYNEKKMRPIPLLRRVRKRLTDLGFVISDDQLWATYAEQPEEEDEGDDVEIVDEKVYHSSADCGDEKQVRWGDTTD